MTPAPTRRITVAHGPIVSLSARRRGITIAQIPVAPRDSTVSFTNGRIVNIGIAVAIYLSIDGRVQAPINHGTGIGSSISRGQANPLGRTDANGAPIVVDTSPSLPTAHVHAGAAGSAVSVDETAGRADGTGR